MPDVTLEREAIALFERALEVPEGERGRWLDEQCAGRTDLRARVADMLAADLTARLRTGAAADEIEEEEPPERIGAYRIAERIGRGGMGSVYRGERMTGDFDHVVAIKIIKPGLLSEALDERFRRERQLLAGLIHPNIAQLHDGGETEAGSPYIVMEHVDGLPLLDWVAQHEPSQSERRRLFCDICGAVAFAHRNLIVHRDLTPSNVLVTADGVVKLIDFGIARPPAAASEAGGTSRPTLASLSLTPGYAAPERMTSGEVTTAADIYSLGKLLARLLPPGRDRELRAIVAKASAEDPLDRYPTADALAQDVKAWADGHPVSAVSGGRRYAFGKFLRRHRLAVAATVGVFLLLGAAFTWTLIANTRAERALADSERRFQETRAIAKALLFDAYDTVSRVPGSTRAREQLARTGLAYLEALAADPDAPVDVKVEAGLGFLRLAQVVGGGQASQLGRYEDGNALLARAEQILSGVFETHGDDPAVRQAMAALLVEQSATNLYNNNDPDAARGQALRAQELMRDAAAENSENARLYASAIQGEGDSYAWTDDYMRARDAHLRAEQFIAALPPALRDHQAVIGVRSANIRLLGEAYHKLDQVEPARAALDQAIQLNRALVRATADDPSLVRKLAISLYRSAIVHRTNRRDAEARAVIAEAVALAQSLRQRDSNDTGALQLFAMTAEVEAQILADAGRFDESFAVGERVIEAHRRMVELAGNAPGALRSLATTLITVGANYYNGSAYPRACSTWREALTVMTGLDGRGELSATDRNNGLPQVRDFLRRNCENGPPRAGMGREV